MLCFCTRSAINRRSARSKKQLALISEKCLSQKTPSVLNLFYRGLTKARVEPKLYTVERPLGASFRIFARSVRED
jgi:hypothetical protein